MIKKVLIENFNSLLKYCHNESVFIINDMYGSKEMTEAWDIIKKQKAVTVSIDSFYLGVIVFQKRTIKTTFHDQIVTSDIYDASYGIK